MNNVLSRHRLILAACAALLAICFPQQLFAEQSSPVAVTVDPRIELMTVVQLLSRYQVLTKVDSDYRRDVEKHFAPFKEHRAIKLFAEMSKTRFAYDAVPKAMLAYSNPPELKPRVESAFDTVRRAGGKQKLEEFIAALRDFAQASKFNEFFAAHAETYERALSFLRPDADRALRELRTYTGLKLENCFLIAGMLVHNGGFQATLGGKENPEIYAIIGALGSKNEIPVFSVDGSVRYLVHHEFSHSYINPLVEKFDDELQKHAALYEPIKEAMQRQAYNNWPTAVHEHIVRAITIRLAYARSQEAGDWLLKAEEERGFKYVRALSEKLKEYEATRNRYPTITDFFPELIKVLN
ncbi:MAG: DUF4932 domain-containing protein [Acidobacteria bacterium]|nr:DUF4932 domain-containing protein [Acidobacteriota bacterium]